ncbi:MAG: hypothetical protein JNM72_21680 [Deltaproteobacteria bacterium]|nr:hypothetical protein [Deltaproteobacteria bacterium]
MTRRRGTPTRTPTRTRTPTLALALALGCGAEEGPKGAVGEDSAAGGVVDSGGEGAQDTGPCAEVPLVNWDTFGAGFVLHHCQGCHASTTPDRYGAPPEVTFDDKEQTWAWRDRILERSAVDPPTMPPAGGTSADDRVRLRWWLECAPEGT